MKTNMGISYIPFSPTVLYGTDLFYLNFFQNINFTAFKIFWILFHRMTL